MVKYSNKEAKAMNKNKQKKQKFEVQDNETIEQCLNRIDQEGYKPIRRTEEPIFQETTQNGTTKLEVQKQQIIFEAIPKTE